MDPFLYAVPIIAFLFFSAVIWLVVRIWGDRLNPNTRRARAQMIRALEQGRAKATTDAENSGSSGAEELEAALMDMPFVPQIARAIASSGVEWSLRNHLFVTVGALIGSALFFSMLGIGIFATLLGTVTLTAVPSAYFFVLADRRARQFENQLPEALDFIARALRSGHALNASFMMVADELPAPIGPEFRRVVDEIAFGIDFQTAMGHLERRIDSRDLSFFVVSLLVQRTTGGNLAEVIGTIAHTVRERMKFHRKMMVLSAEGRISGLILTALPPSVGVLLYAFNPEYISTLWIEPTGRNILALSVIMLGLGYVWIRQIIDIEV
ncbi:MAG: type II secretion system F family protein [Chakrabartia sp.]